MMRIIAAFSYVYKEIEQENYLLEETIKYGC
ncbi:hypothetical protein HBHAL_3724 [Halobacillus halophilus DSM 2266]|uniref:Uncharacterized protein n=1 Tax=Halobacillus halophilus (strain ATCC 35676 / DSM 2266 / JCM 20832 / KCTC 3685 / LMG 17431 / NBRC 102448 / NCIMB 2269) TaxID=866895 RepID=I0JPJ9_HALH3|nr:hypothetical protein HBHAL_3724 [Halobacillus halophilus DSM 2266]